MINRYLKQISLVALALAASAFAEAKPTEQFSDSLKVPKAVENYNEFKIDKWGPVTYSGEGKCDILDLYHSSISQGLGYSTIVDYHYKQTKKNDAYSCESWGLGLSFKVNPDTSKNSENYALPPNKSTPFSAQNSHAIKKLFNSDSAFLEVESITPVTFPTEGDCHKVDFLLNIANEQTGYHGIIDMKYDPSLIDGKNVCTFWGLAVKYKHREVIEKTVTKRRTIEIIKVPLPKPDTVLVPAPAQNCCCVTCCCDHH